MLFLFVIVKGCCLNSPFERNACRSTDMATGSGIHKPVGGHLQALHSEDGKFTAWSSHP